MTVMASRFGLCGIPENLIAAVKLSGVTSLYHHLQLCRKFSQGNRHHAVSTAAELNISSGKMTFTETKTIPEAL